MNTPSNTTPNSDPSTSLKSSLNSSLSKVRIQSLDGKESTAFVPIRELTVKERAKSAFKWLAVFWGIMLAFVPVPMVHLVMVPLFFLIGPVAAVIAFKVKRRVGASDVSCPLCGKPVDLSGQKVRPRFKDRCPNCLNDLYVEFSVDSKA
jgi:hypothetical protein